MRKLLAIALLLLGSWARADESVVICFNYACASEAEAYYSPSRMNLLDELLHSADSAEHERYLLGHVIGQLYAWAGEQTPIAVDRAGNFNDDGASGSMDCIDHSTTTTRFLRMLERRGALRFHRVLEPVQRGRIFEHYSAQIEEIDAPLMEAEADGGRFAIDSWYTDNGQPALVAPLDSWKRMAGIDV